MLCVRVLLRISSTRRRWTRLFRGDCGNNSNINCSIYRVQDLDECLDLFISSIRDAAGVLRIRMTELEVVRVILEEVTLQEQLRLVFAELPKVLLSRADYVSCPGLFK